MAWRLKTSAGAGLPKSWTKLLSQVEVQILSEAACIYDFICRKPETLNPIGVNEILIPSEQCTVAPAQWFPFVNASMESTSLHVSWLPCVPC